MEGGEGWKRKRKRPQEGTKTLDQFVSPLPIVQSGIDSPALGGALVTANSRESQTEDGARLLVVSSLCPKPCPS